MKRTFILFTLVALALTTFAQLPTVRTGKANKDMKFLYASGAQIASCQNNEIVLATYETRNMLGAQLRNGVQAIVTDTNMNILKQVTIPNTGWHNEVLFANVVDGHLFILYRNFAVYNYYRAEVDLQTMTVVKNESILTSYALDEKTPAIATRACMGDKNTNYISWCEKSDNGDFYGIASVELNILNGSTTQHQLLLDNKFEPLWNKSYTVKVMSDMMIDNNGVMYMLGSTYNTDIRKTQISLTTLDVDGDATVEDIYNDGMISSLKLINAQNGIVVAAGAVYHEITKKEKTYDRMVAIAINTKDHTMKMNTREFSIAEQYVLLNKKIKDNSKTDYPLYVMPVQSLKTDNGGVVLFQTRWQTHYTVQNNPDYYVNSSVGTVMLAVDAQGNISWSKPFRTAYDENASFAEDPLEGSDIVLMQHGGNIYFMQQETAKATPTYDVSDVEKGFVCGIKHSWGIYCITPAGDVSKTLYPGSDMGNFCNQMFPLSNNQYLTLFSGKKSAAMYVNF